MRSTVRKTCIDQNCSELVVDLIGSNICFDTSTESSNCLDHRDLAKVRIEHLAPNQIVLTTAITMLKMRADFLMTQIR